MPRVVIVGAGFGGLQCAKTLAGRPVDVLLVDRNDYHLFTPLLYQVASSLLNPSDIAYPVRAVFRRGENVAFRMADVTAVDVAAKSVALADGECLSYDVLAIATGAGLNFFGKAGVERSAYHLNDLPNALALRNHVLDCFEHGAGAADETDRRSWLTFVVVGGGPTGVEYAGALSELVRLMLRRDFRRLPPSDVRVVLLEGGERLLGAFPESLGRHAARRLERLGVDLKLRALVATVEGDEVRLRGGGTLRARTVVWAPGVRPRVPSGELPTTKSGRIQVSPTLEVEGCADVYAIGDAAAYLLPDGRELAMLSSPAMQEGRAVARNVLRRLRGRPARPFRYFDRGIMATIGRHSAVAKLGPLALRGVVGWFAWLFVHLYFIIGFRNRLAILLHWAWNYAFYDRPIRFMVRAADRARDPS